MLRSRGRQKGPNKATDPITRAVIDAIDATGLEQAWICRRAGIGKNTISRWRIGLETPNARMLSYVLEAVGLDFHIGDPNAPRGRPIRLMSFKNILKAAGR